MGFRQDQDSAEFHSGGQVVYCQSPEGGITDGEHAFVQANFTAEQEDTRGHMTVAVKAHGR
ncbi:hypothetical protein GCM10009603_53510 [Nocardiopsis exhalans]